MKFTVDIDCTPEEARQFIGLPNIAPLQDKMMKELEERMSENIRSLDPETFMKTWMPATVQGWGDMQKVFWSQMGMPATGTDKK
ncbi:MAG: hypothetical protein H6868_01580 [Rhodospirillales bacterium]|nr:hypothetical protein [Rhodospirillales bacterium]